MHAHSRCHSPLARSKSDTMASRPSPAFARRILLAARMTSLEIGLRFCGMVLDAPRPGTKGSETSPTSLEDMRMMSRAILPSEPPMRARKLVISAMESRATCQVMAKSCRLSSAASCLRTRRPVSFGPSEARVPAAPPNWTTRQRASSSLRRWRCRWKLER